MARKVMTLAVVFLIVFLPSSSTSAQSTCSSYTFSNASRTYKTCAALPVLNCYLHWTYNSASGTADIAFRATGVSTSSNWVAWALNPTGSQMTGAQALVAHTNSSGKLYAYTSSVSGTGISTLTPSKLSFDVSELAAESTSGSSEIIIYAKVTLPGGKTTANQVWQVGPLNGASPSGHPIGNAPNMNSFGTVNFLSADATASSGGSASSKLKRKNVHGVLNAVSWGILMPIGAIIARYLKVFKSADPAWFYLHITCQCSAYIIGVAGWGTGLKLGSESQGITYHPHRNIGISLFVLATLQVFALLLRPNKEHKFRLYWNIYHHAIGYSVIILSVINVFKGLDILDPDNKWRKAYIGVIIFLGCVALLLEAFTWLVVLRRKKNITTATTTTTTPADHKANNPYAVRSHHPGPGV